MFNTWTRLTRHLPATCQVCGGWPAQAVCTACEQRFAAPTPRCSACAAPVVSSGPGLCGACQTRKAPAALHRCVAAVDYSYPWDTLIARFKFRNEPGWAGPLAALMWRAYQAQPPSGPYDLVVPVPLTPSRLGSRGYNQAWELVKALRRQAATTATPMPPALADALLRIGEAPDQHSLPREQRLHNLRGAFAAHPLHRQRLAQAHVLLVDDVTTTGATLQTAAQALLQAGAQRVDALVLARTPPH